jgi:hypothetical protein
MRFHQAVISCPSIDQAIAMAPRLARRVDVTAPDALIEKLRPVGAGERLMCAEATRQRITAGKPAAHRDTAEHVSIPCCDDSCHAGLSLSIASAC